MIRRFTAVTAAMLVSAPAFGWTHTQNVWEPEDFPLKYWVADDGTVPNSITRCEESGGLEGCCEETVPAGYCRDAAAQGFDAWHDAQCAEFSVEYVGVNENITYTNEGKYFMSFNDPGDENEPGVLAATSQVRGPGVRFQDGQQYYRFQDTDIVFNDAVDFTTHEDVVGGTCASQIDMLAVMTHEIGHSLGMGHSCEDPDKGGAPCTDPILRDATMFWTSGSCDPQQAEISQDDIEGINALYGPFATFECSHQVSDDLSIGVVPFDMHCVIISESLDEVVSADWNFGDGGTASTITPTHTYTDPGNYTIQLEVKGAREECGPDGWTNNFRRVGYVRACGIPDAAFEVTHVDGLQYKMINDSDVSVYGCISNISWAVYKGEGISGEPILDGIEAWDPQFELPEAGTYTVVMNLGGIAGTGAAMATFEAKDRAGEGSGCSTVSGSAVGGFGAIGALALGALVGRRRR
ncbi:MAG: PKD domain-containing protein [Myxococcota bacterium]